MADFKRPDSDPDWSDTVYGPLRFEGKTSRELFMMGLDNLPKWFQAALKIRNLVVAPFGLKTEFEGTGHFLARLPVLKDTEHVFETGIDDKHLTFTLCLKQQEGIASMKTNIWFNSLLGKFYLTIIKPGHILAVKNLCRTIAHPVNRAVGEWENTKGT